MVDLIQGQGHPAKLTYRANQRINAISPHITAQGASGIDAGEALYDALHSKN